MKYNLLYNTNLKNIINLGLHIGTKKQKLNLKNGTYIKGFRHNVNIYNIEKSLQSFKFLFFGLTEIFKKRNKFMLINPTTDLMMSYFLKNQSNKNLFMNFYLCSIVDRKWLNGSLSNWKSIKNLWYFLKNKKKYYDSNLQKKKYKNNKFHRYMKYFHSLNSFQKTRNKAYPDFIILLKNDYNAMLEIKNQYIPLIGTINTDMNPDFFLYKTFGNINNLSSLIFFFNLIKKTIINSRLSEQKLFIKLIIYYIKKNI